MTTSRQLCTFHVGELYLGIDVMDVQEVIRYQEMTSVPLAPQVVSGLINLRGEIVTALDLRRQLGLPDRPAEAEPPMNVVVRDGRDEAVSLLVDDIDEVVQTDEADFEPVPATVTGPAADLLLGSYALPDRLLLLLDTEKARVAGTGIRTTDEGEQL
jgi:purine-binding chemotaxis protein CheW